MSAPLMPKATAIWLLDNTTLTFEQIGDYCHLHTLEIKAIADGEIAVGMAPFDPIAHGRLTMEEIERCSRDPAARLVAIELKDETGGKRRGGGRYVPVSKRADKPDAIAWMLKHHPEVSDAELCRLLGTTSPTVHAIRDKTHWNSANLRSRSPVVLGLCTQEELNKVIEDAKK
jgi:uncharacterized protein